MGDDHDFGARLVEALKTHRPRSRNWISQLSDMPYAMLQELKSADRQRTLEIIKDRSPYRYDWNVCFLISRDGTPEEVVECIEMTQQSKWQKIWPFLPTGLMTYLLIILALMSSLSR